jgi:hypothetical protein
MTDARRTVSTAVLAIMLAGCSSESTPSAVQAPVASNGPADTGQPTACLDLSAEDCERVRGIALSTLERDDPAPVYVQVGPFGCAAGERCPETLVARPEGDVVIEFAGGSGASVHLRVAPDGRVETTRGEAFGIALAPSSAPGIASSPLAFTLGHCGIFSGIDLDGAWWDPVGPIDTDSGDAINATAGAVTVLDPTHALFTAPSGFAVQLERRAGSKFLPMCD